MNKRKTGAVQVKWRSPNNNWICLNTNGVVEKESEVGCGGILRNNQGKWKGGFNKHIGKSNNHTVELWGVLTGLSMEHIKV